jgi:hypothetical protein
MEYNRILSHDSSRRAAIESGRVPTWNSTAVEEPLCGLGKSDRGGSSGMPAATAGEWATFLADQVGSSGVDAAVEGQYQAFHQPKPEGTLRNAAFRAAQVRFVEPPGFPPVRVEDPRGPWLGMGH